jgi:outer membrane immunogenic protein
VKSLKLTLLSATFLAGASIVSGANAADVYERGGSYKDTPVSYAAITWSGFYAGINLGAAFDDDDDDDDFKDVEVSRRDDDDDDATFLAGVHVGYNWQKASNLVLGVEGDVSFGDDIDYLASLRGRLGWAAGPTLFYATGGVAFIGLDDNGSDDDEDSETGWVAGLGVEHKLRDNVSIGLEGLYYAFDEDNNGSGNDDENDFWTVRARLTYHFGGARYDEALK